MTIRVYSSYVCVFLFLFCTVFLVTGNVFAATNLILNPSLETVGATGDPENWFRGGWGTNTRVFTYPVAGTDGASAAKVEIMSYTNGDAKWYFADVPVTGGNTYAFAHRYHATAPSDIFVRYTVTSGGFQYQFIETLPITSAWTATSRDITVPANAVSMTIFHLIRSIGSLSIDAYNLNSNTTSDTVAPTVSVTSPASASTLSGITTVLATAADPAVAGQTTSGVSGVTLLIDGAVVGTEDTTAPYEFSWNTSTVANGAHTISARARDAAGNTADATAVSITVSNTALSSNLILNPSLETADSTGKKPVQWTNSSWGNLQATLTYPVAGYQSTRAAEISLQQRTTGDAKWYFNDVTVLPGARYNFSDMYRANVSTEIDVRFRLANGTYSYLFLAIVPAAADWKAFNVAFTAPNGATAATVLHVIARVGKLTVDDYKLTAVGETTLPPPPSSGDFSEGMVSLVFDDGWQTSYDNAFPILESHGFKATHYIITNTYKEGNTGYMTAAEILDLQKRGHEVAAHTRTHTDLTTLFGQALVSEVAGSRQDLLNLGISPVATFAYPYGNYNDAVIATVKNAGFSAARSIISGLNFKKGTDKYLLKWRGPEITTTFADMRGWVDEAISKKGWLIISFHKINNSSDQYNTTPANLTAVADYLKSKNVRVITVADGAKMLGE